MISITDALKITSEETKKYIDEKQIFAIPQSYGANGSTLTDLNKMKKQAINDTKALQDCIRENSSIFLPTGEYYINDTIIIENDKLINFAEGAKLIAVADVSVLEIRGRRITIDNPYIDTRNVYELDQYGGKVSTYGFGDGYPIGDKRRGLGSSAIIFGDTYEVEETKTDKETGIAQNVLVQYPVENQSVVIKDPYIVGQKNIYIKPTLTKKKNMEEINKIENPSVGKIIYNEAEEKEYQWNGIEWKEIFIPENRWIRSHSDPYIDFEQQRVDEIRALNEWASSLSGKAPKGDATNLAAKQENETIAEWIARTGLSPIDNSAPFPVYRHGYGIRFFKRHRGTLAMHIHIIRPRIIGFSASMQVYVDKKYSDDAVPNYQIPNQSSSPPWITELHLDGAVFEYMGHGLEVSPNWIQACSFSGSIQAHKQRQNPENKNEPYQKYMAFYNGDHVKYNIMYWDTNGTHFIVLPDARVVVNRYVGDRLICHDFGNTIWADNVPKTITDNFYCNGITTRDLLSHKINIDEKKDRYNIILKENSSTAYFYCKDNFSNFLLPFKPGTKTISFDVKSNFEGKIYGLIAPLQDKYLSYGARWCYSPSSVIKEISLSEEASENNDLYNKIIATKTNDLNVGDNIIIWGIDDLAYGYPVTPTEYTAGHTGHTVFKIQKIETNENESIITVDTPIGYYKNESNNWELIQKNHTGKSIADELIGCNISKIYKNTYELSGTYTRLQSSNNYTASCNFTFEFLPDEDLVDMINPDYLGLGFYIIKDKDSTDGSGKNELEISNLRIKNTPNPKK